ncbi:MAG: 2OG-Fe(II) oxygenase [Pseudomonadota bacterium]
MQRAPAAQRIALAPGILQIGQVHESAPGSQAEALYRRAIDRARTTGLHAAEPDLRQAALAGHHQAARAFFSLALRKANDGDYVRSFLEQLLASAASKPYAWLLGAEWHRFHSTPDDSIRWAEYLSNAYFAALPDARALVSLYAQWQSRRAPPAEASASPEALALWLGRCEKQWSPPAASVIAEGEGVRVTLARSFAPPAALDFPLRQLTPHLAPTLVVDPRSGRRVAHPVRDASFAQWLPELLGWHGKLLEQRLALAGGYPRECGEVTNLLRYVGGQAYRPHLDCLPRKALDTAEGQVQGGQRLLTQLVGVLAPYAGGETYFEHLGVQVTLAPGDLLTFNNANGEGHPLAASRHGGAPVAGGEKVIMSKWVRQTATPYGRELAHTL